MFDAKTASGVPACVVKSSFIGIAWQKLRRVTGYNGGLSEK
jgi:hypothetical protein